MAPDAGPSAELRLLLAAASPRQPPLPGLEEVDWRRLSILAERHRMAMLLARRLLGHPALPGAEAAWLTGEARSGAARALSMTAELARALAVLEGAGIRAAAYKGPALAVTAYGDASLRWCSDLDVLVEPAGVPGAMAVLAEAGYHPLREYSAAQEAAFRRVDGDYPLRHGTSGTLLELHCHVSPRRFAARFDTHALLDRRTEVACGPFRIPALASGDLLLALAVHGAKHRWARMEWLAAFAGLLVRSGEDAAALVEAGDALGAGRAARVGLALCRRLLGMDLPEWRDEAVRRLTAAAAERMLGDQPRYDAADTADNLRFNLQLCDTPADRVRTAWRWLTISTPEDWSWRPLPDALFPAYRVLRPARLLARYGPRR